MCAMRTTLGLIRVLISLAPALLVSCASPSAPPEFRTTATVKDIMDALVDPSADGLWDSVSYVTTAAGTVENAPRTDDDWKALRRHAIVLMEASNMLLVPGRHVAQPGEQAEDLRVERSPEDIQAMISHDVTQWTRFAHGLHDAASENLSAVTAKNVEQLLAAGDTLDAACERCHVKYWYRVEPAADAASQRLRNAVP